eukprot:SAG11_NODE_34731_length_270_cov_0.900585_2_plen_56_part_01
MWRLVDTIVLTCVDTTLRSHAIIIRFQLALQVSIYSERGGKPLLRGASRTVASELS